MNKILIILFVLFTSCNTSKKTLNKNNIKQEVIELDFLFSYKTSIDTMENKVVINYRDLKLKEERKEKKFKLLLQGETVLTGSRDKYHYLFEVFQNSFLLVSYVKGKSYAAGPDLFERDNVIILDLKTSKLNKVNLDNIYLTRSKDFLLKNYYHKDKLKYKNENTYCNIEKIDLGNNRILLFTENLETKEYITINLEKPFNQAE